ncbi:RHS repeat-associated core domain-containing protein [Amycolatopsis sp. 195334CR]|uniref:RHS repeat-associated core domain-containing protein n=1 Tax=Amycolatopsis sp. 195334CR TaxID=2814588 RepID=UPI001A904167|nr:RHS repeat-associated core domain-containing protein [Amycolatopsis sp. 195334CR]MBN6033669.1 RHS repeat protein [Amycolatopsis sp. 195334CR]
MANPLVAEVEDSTTAISGVPILESINETSKAIESGDWAAGVMGAAGTALDALGMAMDPFGSILAAGVGWLIEHCGPLSDALDALTGNPDEIKAHSETWKNVGTELSSISADLAKMIEEDTASWTGPAGDAYRTRGADIATLITGAQSAAEGASSGIGTAGEVVGAVRSLVRDIIAELVGHMISWALQVLFTLGIGLAWVVPQVVSAVAKTAMKIADITKKLVQALSKLSPLLKKLGDSFGDAAKALKNIKSGNQPKPETTRGGGGDTSPSSSGPTPNPPPGQSNNGGGGGGDTTSSSAKPDGSSGTPPPPAPKPDPTPNPTPTPSPTPTPTPTPRGGGNNTPPRPNDTGPGARDRSIPDQNKTCVTDPVDVARGEVLMTQVDLVLPGDAGELVLSRTHLSGYRFGRWFGPSWASTVDQRLEVGREAVRFYAEDGMVLVYPVPAGASVLPLEGPRYPLHVTPEGYRLSTGERELHFAGTGHVVPLTAIEQYGSRTEFRYGPDGAPAGLRRDDGTEIQFSAADGRVVALGAPGAAPLVRFGYNRLRQLSAVADYEGRPMTLDYDFEHRLVGWQDRNGTWYRYVYDQSGRCVRTAGANGYYNSTFAYEPGVTRHTDALGHTWTYRMNEAGQLVERIDPLGGTRRYSWSRYDLLLSEVDEIGRETRYEYEHGELVAVVRADGSVLASGAAVALPRPGTPSTSTGPTAAPDPMADEQVTDAAARPGRRDLFGRPQLVYTASGGETRLGWTAQGRRAWRVGPHGDRQAWVHDAEGQVVEYRDAAGGVRRRVYGPFGLVLEDIDTAGARTTYTYDGELRPTSVTNPQGLTWRYTYDAAGRLVEETDFDGRRLTYAYDAAGQMRRMTNGLGQPTEFDYDPLGNVVARRTTEEVTRYSYDEQGHLVVAENPESRLEIIRDGRGRVVTETINGLGVCWDYDDTGIRRLTSSGVDSEWSFDEHGLPRSLRIGGHEVGFAYDHAAREVVRSVDGEVVLTRRFDAEDRLAAEEISGVGQRTYGYRPDGRLAAVDDAARPWRLSFDQAGRISEAHGPAGVERFTHDSAGRITSAASPVLPGQRTHRGNALLSAGSTRYTGDGQGRVTGRHRTGPDGERSWTYTWDQLDRLRGATTPDGTRWTYHYDPLGRRFAKRRWITGEDGQPELAEDVRFLWSGFDLVERVRTDADGATRILTWERHPGDSRPLVQVERSGSDDPGSFRSVITSPAGAPTELLDERGAVVWQDRGSFWGAAGTRSEAMPLAFPGQYRDEETGLSYNVFRYYDPETARYLSQDPLGLAAAPNPVQYVAEPLLVGDPLGLVPSCGKTGGPETPKRPRPDDFDQHPDLKPPPPKRTDLGVDVLRMTPEEFQKFKPELDKMMNADKHFFWSGGYKQHNPNGDDPYLGSIEFKANQIAKEHGGNTLEGLIADNKLKMPDWVPPSKMNDPNQGFWSHGDHGSSNLDQKKLVSEKWDYASETFAKNSKEDTHVVFPDKPGDKTSTGIPNPNGDIYPYRRPDNIFDKIEYPKLEEQGIKVTEHNAETGGTRPYRKP